MRTNIGTASRSTSFHRTRSRAARRQVLTSGTMIKNSETASPATYASSAAAALRMTNSSAAATIRRTAASAMTFTLYVRSRNSPCSTPRSTLTIA